MSVDNTSGEVSALVDRLGHPNNMSRDQWIEFLEEVMGDCEGKLEAAREEKAADKDGG